MASKSAQDITVAEIMGDHHEFEAIESSVVFSKERTENPEELKESLSYTLASDQSQFSSNVDSWLKETKLTANTGVQGSRVPMVQRSTLVTLPSLVFPGVSYFLATVVPLFSVGVNNPYMRCLPGTIMKIAELVLTQVLNIFEGVQRHLRRLVRDRDTREFTTAAINVILIIYAVGFLFLSMYQAVVFG